MILEISPSEFELIEHSVAMRLQTWRWTEEYLRTGSAEGMIAECHKLSEAQWVVAQYEALYAKFSGTGRVGSIFSGQSEEKVI